MRKLATAAAVSLVLASGGVHALGLGDIEMRSALNQPMNAEIRLTSVKPGETDGMIVQLASADAFTRAGIERTQSLQDLRFSVDQSGGTPVIRITSRQPVIEPFLNFLLEVDWPQGRMVREYTVLLDPPVFMTPSASDRNAAADSPAIVQNGQQSILTPTPIDRSGTADTFDESTVVVVDGTGEVGDNDVAGTAISLDGLSGGETVSLDGLNAADSAGEAVALTDLAVPNTAATAQIAENQAAAADDFEFEVELVGAGEDVTDAATELALQPGSGAAGGESDVVSLEELDLAADVAVPAQNAVANDVTVQRGDTLYEIAQSNRVGGASVQQMMLALVSANQNAFINGNINLVKAGSILRIPTQNEATALTQSQALAQISQQNQLWQEYRDNLRQSQATRLAQNTAPAETAPAATDASADATSTEAEDAAAGGLSDDARAILETARAEVQAQDELKIVADNQPTTTAASATADESNQSNSDRLGEINRKLQLAREELASSRLQTDDLGDQASELQSTSENLDALVTLRQTEVAQLEAQLAAARQQADAGAAAAGTAVADASAAVADGAVDLATGAAAAGNSATELFADAASSTEQAGNNALTAAGQQLESVELIDDSDAAGADTTLDTGAGSNTASTSVQAAAPAALPWYQQLLQNKQMAGIIGGLAALMALGLGWLLFRRKRKSDDRLDYADDVEFIDDAEQAELQNDLAAGDVPDGFGEVADAPSHADTVRKDSGVSGAAAAVAAAGVAGVAGVAASASDKADDAMDAAEEFMSFDSPADASDDEDDLDKDDTISEVDVYLAYGLHGQAEELLTAAIERNPENQEYSVKLLQTYHAQGNTDAFDKAAGEFHARFGGESNPSWEGIAAMGHEMAPTNALYSGAAEEISSVGRGGIGAPQLNDSDFATDTGSEISSISRDFSTEEQDSSVGDDETALMDQSLDPAFAFDESDLEATGDFSQIANELASEEAESIDFPDFDQAVDKASEAASDLGDSGSDLASGAVGAVTGLAAGAAGMAAAAGDSVSEAASDLLSDADQLGSELDSDLGTDLSDDLGDALSLDELDVGGAATAANDGIDDLDLSAVADDLTLDLEQLSGDLELDSTELLDDGLGTVSDLEIPDLTSDNELLSGGTASLESADEMDTMMDLAKAYIDMGDKDSASSALGEIVKSGSPAQVSEAETLLRKIS